MTFKKIFIIIITLLFLVGCSSEVGFDDSYYSDSTDLEEITNNDSIYSDKKNKYGNSSSNIHNGGYVAQQGEWIYYSNSSDNWSLYKVKVNGEDKTKLFDSGVYDINVSGEWVYITVNNGLESGTLWKVKVDGTESNILIDNVVGVYLEEDSIYYNSTIDGGFYKIDIDGKNKIQLVNEYVDGFGFYYYDDWFYYFDIINFSMNKINRNGDKIVLINDIASADVIIDDWIYYVNGSDSNKIYKIKIDGTKKTKVIDDETHSINILGEWIYYDNNSDLGRLYKIKLDGTEKTKVCDDEVSSINIIDDWIYYRNDSDYRELYRIKVDGTEREKVE